MPGKVMKKFLLKTARYGIPSVLLVITLVVSGFNPQNFKAPEKGNNKFPTVEQVGSSVKTIFTVGTSEASTTPDYLMNANAADVAIQAALNALPSTGGIVQIVSSGTVTFTATVSRAINNVTIIGANGLLCNYDASTPLFSLGTQSNWRVVDIQTDAGGITYASATNYILENVTIGATKYSYLTNGSITSASINAPTGRGATYVIAASDATATEIAQADIVCDGTADDVQINDAIVAGNKSISLSTGHFGIAATILLDDDVTLSGQGDATILTLANTVNDSVISNTERTPGSRSATSNYRITLKDLYVDGNKDNQTADGQPGFSDNASVMFSTVEKLTISNITVVNGWPAGIRTEFVTYFVITGNRSNLSGDDTIAINEESFYGTVSNNVVTNAGTAGNVYGAAGGIEVQDGSHDVTIIGNTILNPNYNGIAVHNHAGKNPAYNITVTGNTVRVASDRIGIRLYGDGATYTTGNVVSNNTVAGTIGVDATITGIRLQNAQYNTVSGNTVNNFTEYGIYLTTSSFNIVTANNIVSVGGSGVSLASSAGTNIVSSNRVATLTSNSIAAAFYILGDDNSITGNFTHDTNANIWYGIWLASGADGNSVRDNFLGWSTVSGVRNQGLRNDVYGNAQWLAPGEIRTYSGSIATLAQNAYNSVDNPFGQSVRVLKLDVYVSTQATSTTPNLDCGIGASATTDYTTLFDDLPGETVGFYTSTIATPGTQTVPQLWASGSGNRYLIVSIKDAAATGMVATYTVTVMGN